MTLKNIRGYKVYPNGSYFLLLHKTEIFFHISYLSFSTKVSNISNEPVMKGQFPELQKGQGGKSGLAWYFLQLYNNSIVIERFYHRWPVVYFLIENEIQTRNNLPKLIFIIFIIFKCQVDVVQKMTDFIQYFSFAE